MTIVMVIVVTIPIFLTLVGILTDVSDVHSKAPGFILVTVVGMVMLVIGHFAYW